MFGWNGKIAKVYLTERKTETVPLDEEFLTKYLGGRGLGVKFVYDLVKPGIDPLSSENILVLATGPLTGTTCPTSGRYATVSKSPLTGSIFDSNSGGNFGPELKFAGFDGLVVLGKAEEPVYIEIHNGKISIKDAKHLWGKNTREVNRELSKFGRVACIGKAGEKGVRFANIMNDYTHTCGRGGLGAVMGSKNLKAIVVKGNKKISISDRERYKKYFQDITRLLVASPVSSKGLSEYGTAVLVNLTNYMRILPTGNFRFSRFDFAEEISGEKINSVFPIKKTPCYACPIACKREVRNTEMEVPEYETISMFGSSCRISNIQTIMRANRLCNEYGIDTITTGSTIACYAELKGEELTDKKLLELVELIGERKGIGQELCEGSMRFARANKSPDISMQVKGLELPGYDPRGVLGLALGYATSNRGGCHLRAYMIGPEIFGKPKLVNRLTFSGKSGLVQVIQNLFTAVDSLVVCKFALFSVGEEEWANILSAVTGIEFVSESLLEIGERIWNIERLFNLTEKFSNKDDTLPERFFQEDGGVEGRNIKKDEFLASLLEYYRFRGWDREGIPTKEKLAQLNIQL